MNKEQLHPYQIRTVEFIKNNPSAFGIQGLGLGKTVSALTAVSDLLDECMVRRVLVVAPLRVAKHTWPNEIAKWDHLARLTCNVAIGTARVRIAAVDNPSDIVVINRENVPWLVTRYRDQWPFDMIVVDESSSFKSPSALRFRALRSVMPRIHRAVCLTATPAPNSRLDLWSQVFLLDQGTRLDKSYYRFCHRYFSQDPYGFRWELKKGAGRRIDNAISDICNVLTVEDHLRLPGMIHVPSPVHLSPEEYGRYKAFEAESVMSLGDSEISAVNAAAMCQKLQQLAQGAVYGDPHEYHHVHNAKLEALGDILEAVPNENVMLVYAYRHDAARIRDLYPHAVDARDQGAIERWSAGKIRLLLVHPASAGYGLNLQSGGHRIVWFGLTWSSELWDQVNGRLYRQGQTMPVYVHIMAAVGTIDEKIQAVVMAKGNKQAAMIEAVKGLRGKPP